MMGKNHLFTRQKLIIVNSALTDSWTEHAYFFQVDVSKINILLRSVYLIYSCTIYLV